MHLPRVENKGSSLGQRTSDVAVNREKHMNPHPHMNAPTARQKGDRARWRKRGVLDELEGAVVHREWDYLIGRRVGGNCFFQGPC